MKEFLKGYFTTIVAPAKSFESLLGNRRNLHLSFLYILIPIVLYTLMYIFLTIANGAPSVFSPWLNIPKEEYYSVNRFLLAPSMILCWLFAAAFIQVVCKLANGKGSFEQTASVLALSISIAMWGGLIHDLPMSFLSAVGLIDARQHEIDMNSPTIYRTLLWICYSLYLVAFLVLFPLAVRVVHKLSLFQSILVGSFAFIIFQVIFLLFNR